METLDYVMGNFITPGNVTKVQYDKLTKLEYKHYNTLINLLCNVDTITDNKKYMKMFSIYTSSVISNKTYHSIDLEGGVDNQFYGTLQADGENIYLHNYHASIMGAYINSHETTQYLFFPLVASIEVKGESGHALCVVVDTKRRELYLMDPNGKTSYYDNILVRFSKNNTDLHIPDEFIEDMYIDSSFKIDQLFKCYLDDINKYLDHPLKFISSFDWNPLRGVLNRKLSDGITDSGNCVAITIFLMHYLSLTNSSLINVYKQLLKYTDEELSSIINSYSLSICNLVLL